MSPTIALDFLCVPQRSDADYHHFRAMSLPSLFGSLEERRPKLVTNYRPLVFEPVRSIERNCYVFPI